MSIHKLFLVLISFLVVSSAVFADAKPGDFADYKLDKNPKRTSNLIRDGKVRVVMGELQQNASQVPAYEVFTQYKFNLALMGNYEGEEKKLFEREYFSEEFLDKLRKDGHYEGNYFKATHQGFEDVHTLQGKFYPHCDKILLYDMKDSDLRETSLNLLALAVGNADAKIDDLKALVHISAGIPVFSAAQLDVSGTYQGTRIKAGGDYTDPH